MSTLTARLRTGFLGDVLKLSFGTIGGRLVWLLAMPVMTRLYSPDDFALLASYLALVSTIGVIACLRLEIAIPIVESDDEAAHLLVLAMLVVAGVVASLLAVALLVPDQVSTLLGKPELGPYL